MKSLKEKFREDYYASQYDDLYEVQDTIEKDVQEAIKEFQKEISKQEINEHGSLVKGLCKNDIEKVLELHKKIFGEWKE